MSVFDPTDLTRFAQHLAVCSMVRTPGHKLCDCGLVYALAYQPTPAEPGLDVGRLRQAVINVKGGSSTAALWQNEISAVAAEYAALESPRER